MKKVIIGSTAIKHWYPEYQKVPNDLDYAVDVEGVKNTREIEHLYNPIITSLETGKYLRPEYLLTLKMSHLFWNINWEKHMFHVQYLLGKGIKYDVDLFYELYDFWNDYHSKNRRSDLKMSKEDFFNNAINTEIDHDYIHTLINPSPVYKKTLKEGKDVETEESKFYDLTFQEKLDIVREEVMVMAWERYAKRGYKTAYSMMLKKFIIGHAPMYMALFIIENFITLHKAEFNFIEKINKQL